MATLDHHGLPFATNSCGSTIFGEITEYQAVAMDTHVAAPVKLSEGDGRYGESHMQQRVEQLIANGYHDVRTFVGDVTANFDEIRFGNSYPHGKKSFLLAKKISDTSKYAVVYVELSPDRQYYDVNSGGVFNEKYVERRKLLWAGGTHLTRPSD